MRELLGLVGACCAILALLGSGPACAESLREARAGFRTQLRGGNPWAPRAAPQPPPELFRRIRYPTEAGELVAYVTPDPGDGVRRPAVLWAHGGFGGIGRWLWEPAPPDNDQTARAFRDAGLVLMIPSWRGENRNPGRFELFYGEVDDLLAARRSLAALPYVDPSRIYLAGHSTGGTLALLAAASGADFAAIFSFGGAPDLWAVVSDGEGYGNTPFDPGDREESRLRSAIEFTEGIRVPTYYIEGEDSFYVPHARAMAARARRARVPFQAFIVRGANHFDVLAPLTTLIAQRIVGEWKHGRPLTLSEADINRYFTLQRQQGG
ncbi:MAG: prolyl oligopeptidase family serine peptidase [Myxococcota bacterium]|nr:prolyl oligopeptidase family serine peptidase [Myxococcota bacterium]